MSEGLSERDSDWTFPLLLPEGTGNPKPARTPA